MRHRRRRTFIVLAAQTLMALAMFACGLTLLERVTDRTPHLNEVRSVYAPPRH